MGVQELEAKQPCGEIVPTCVVCNIFRRFCVCMFICLSDVTARKRRHRNVNVFLRSSLAFGGAGGYFTLQFCRIHCNFFYFTKKLDKFFVQLFESYRYPLRKSGGKIIGKSKHFVDLYGKVWLKLLQPPTDEARITNIKWCHCRYMCIIIVIRTIINYYKFAVWPFSYEKQPS